MIKSHLAFSMITLASRISVGVLIFFFLASNLSVEQFGTLTYVFTISVVLGIFIDFGLNLKLARDMVGVKGDYGEILSQALTIKLFNTTLFLALVWPVVLFLELDFETLILTCVFFASQSLQVISFTYFSYLRSNEKFRKEAEISTISNLIIVFSFFFLYQFKSLELYAYGIAIIIGRVFILFFLFNLFKYRMTLKNIIDDYLKSVSYFFHGLVGYLLLSLDTILIGVYLDIVEVGKYQSIMKLVGGIILVTEAMNNVSLTKFTGLYNARDFSGFKKLKRQILILSLSLGLMFAAIAIFTVMIVFPKFLDESYTVSVSTLTLLVLVIPVRFYTVYYAVTLTVFDLQMKRVKFSLYALCIMFATISLFVPFWSVEGAAGAMLLTSLSLLYFYRKECVINEKKLFI